MTAYTQGQTFAFALDKIIATLNSLFDGHLIPLYWSGVFSAVRLFPFLLLFFSLNFPTRRRWWNTELTREVQINKSNESTNFAKSDMIMFGRGLGENGRWYERLVATKVETNGDDGLYHFYFPWLSHWINVRHPQCSPQRSSNTSSIQFLINSLIRKDKLYCGGVSFFSAVRLFPSFLLFFLLFNKLSNKSRRWNTACAGEVQIDNSNKRYKLESHQRNVFLSFFFERT